MVLLALADDASIAWIEHDLPEEIRAGELLRWSLTLRFREMLSAGARIGLARHWPSDWGIPQGVDPAAPDHVTVTASNGARLVHRAMRRPKWHPFDHAFIIESFDPIEPETTLRVAFGDGDSPGASIQTFVEERCPLSIRIRYAGCPSWTEVGRIFTRVVGASPDKLVATAPSIVTAGAPFEVHVRARDRWGNPASDVDLDITLEGAPGRGRLTSGDGSFVRIETVLAEPGIHRLKAAATASGFETASNPIRCDKAPGTRLFWGDIHAQSSIGCGAQSIETYFRFARDFAAVDLASHQGNCFLVSGPEWRETQEVTQRLREDGRFVTLLGYEWSGATELGGDHNIYFPGEAAPIRRCSHKHIADASDLNTDLPHIDDFQAHYRGTDTLIAVHVGGRTSNLAWHEPSTERLLEVHSTHATSEWFLFEALRRGYRFGVTGGSDGVDGRPGASHPGRMSVRNLRGGLVAVAARELSRGELWSALKARRTYATTGERILLSFEIAGRSFGEEHRTIGAPRFDIAVEGTGPLRSVEIFRGVECVHAAPIAPLDPSPSADIRIAWQGASGQGNWERARMIWDGHLDVLGGRLGSARDYARDSAGEGIFAQSPHRIEWRSITAGNWNGITLTLAYANPETVLRLTTGPISCEFALRQLDEGPVERRLSDPDRVLRVERLPRLAAPAGWSGEFIDHEAANGEHAYWLRVRQDDGAAAWSSPIFVKVKR